MSTIRQPSDASRLFRATVALVLFHGFLWGVGLLELFWWGARAARTFRDFNMRLPVLTELVLTLSRWVENHALYVGIFVLLVLVTDGMVYRHLRASAPQFLSKLWSALMFFLPFAVIMGTMIGIMTPLLALTEALSR